MDLLTSFRAQDNLCDPGSSFSYGGDTMFSDTADLVEPAIYYSTSWGETETMSLRETMHW